MQSWSFVLVLIIGPFTLCSDAEEKEIVEVLMWSGGTWAGFGNWPILQTPNYLGHSVNKSTWDCPIDCRFHGDKNRLQAADAVMYEAQPVAGYYDDYKRDLPNFPGKHRNQYWVSMGYEHHKYFMFYGEPGYVKYVDINMTFSQDSQVPITFTCLWGGGYGKGINDFLIPPAEKPKGRGVLFIATNCQSGGASWRTAYTKELMKHIQIDSYGQCLHNKDLPPDMQFPIYSNHGQSMANKVKTFESYKFVLTFENNNITDYVTEKMINVLQARAVPVYMGAPNVHPDWTPGEKAIIKTSDFEGPKELAKYLQFLLDNEDEYQKYHDWRKVGLSKQFTQRFNDCVFYGAECRLCQYISERKKKLAAKEQQEIKERKAREQRYHVLTFERPNHYLTVASSPALDLTEHFTISLWARPRDFEHPLLDRGVWKFGTRTVWKKSFFELCIPNECFASSHQLVDNSWSHVVVVFDYREGPTGSVQFYVNGLKDPHTDVPHGHPQRTDYQANPLVIGTDVAHQNFYSGELDDVSIWSIAVTEKKAINLVWDIMSGGEDGLVAFWDFNHEPGSVVRDRSPNQLDAQTSGDPRWSESFTKPIVTANPCM
eukprot:TRINITY_DN1075_c0_g3_i2.p1 TRINITY_DN1075_c0_g3~~TRINITY_DN1075_c0_g3_i2.p1  ORF type:complete len:611 (+),score=192.62 TRINITY_DN1075_c0_g3_i2:38-1834(+)